MVLDMVYFPVQPVTVLTVDSASKFLARLLVGDPEKLSEGSLVRTAMLNATGGMLGTLLLARESATRFSLFFLEENADALQAWARQVSQAFDAEISVRKLSALPFVGDLAGEAPARGHFIVKTELTLLNRGWMSYAIGEKEPVETLISKLTRAGVNCADPGVMEALRIMAREPACGLEYDETKSPLETGLEDALDFSDASRIFIGRALTEARRDAGGYERLNLVAFNVPFDPSALTEIPLIISGEFGYQPTSLVRISEMNLTAGLVRLPHEVEIGATLEALVKTDPPCAAKSVLVVAPQT